MTDFYKLPFNKAKKYLPRVFLRLNFIKDLGLDPKKMIIKAYYSNTGSNPILMVDGNVINSYISFEVSKEFIKEAKWKQPQNTIQLGYKHFDKWKFENGDQIGCLKSELEVKQGKLNRKIKREALGFFGYWLLRLQNKI